MIDSTLKNAKILIVDDKVPNIEILEDLIGEAGYLNYRSTTDSREVAGLFQSFGPDILLLDLMMPYLNGFEVMEQLAGIIPANTYFPILVLTADISPESKRKALSSGARDFLSKPFDLDEVKLRVRNLLETRFLYQQLENQNQILEQKVKERTIDLEQANNALDLANQELAVLDRAKNDFLRLISHEIRTPLNGIKGFTSLLKEEIASPELLGYLNYLEKSTVRLENFSYQALLITELHTGKHKVHLRNIVLKEVIATTEANLQDKIEEKGITVRLKDDLSIHSIQGDLELVQICFECILDNSVKYSPSNAQVELRISSDHQSTFIEFIDYGRGFPQKILNNPFMVFGLGDQHIDKNTGLNLALVKLIMDAHHGRAEIGNNAETGAMVKLTFPHQR